MAKKKASKKDEGKGKKGKGSQPEAKPEQSGAQPNTPTGGAQECGTTAPRANKTW